MEHNKNLGFTLIEMSIVLIIIGLIVGGVLAGKNMIAAANMRSQITELQKYKTAVKLFDEMYKGIPGDINNAQTLFGAATANGNGNGFLEAATDATMIDLLSPDNGWYDGERPHFFIQLYLAKLINQPFDGSANLGTGYPRNILNKNTGMFAAGPWNIGGIGIFIPPGMDGNGMYPNLAELNTSNLYLAVNIAQPNMFNVAGPTGGSSHNDSAGVFTPAEMWEMERKIDDNIPSTGKITAQAVLTVVSCGNAITYNLSAGDNRVCNLHYDLTD
jgi:prepilin-type N-terminal cleavage/methylation domain-containing protein